MAIQLKAAYDFLHDQLNVRRGPALSFSRASVAWEEDIQGTWVFHDDDFPRFHGGWAIHNFLLSSENLAHANWTNDGLETPVTGYSDPFGGDTAWMLQEDTTTGFHSLNQDSGIYGKYDGRVSVTTEVWFKHGGTNPAQYAFIGYAGSAAPTTICVLDLASQTVVDSAEYYTGYFAQYPPQYNDADHELVFADAGNGWTKVMVQGAASTTTRDNLVFGFSNTAAQEDVPSGHTGSGRTMLVCRPSMMKTSGFWIYEPPNYYVPSTDTTMGMAYARQQPVTNVQLNSEMHGYAGKGTAPDGIGWSGAYGWAEGTTTGDGAVTDSPFASASAKNSFGRFSNRGAGDTEQYMNGVRCSGTAQQYWLVSTPGDMGAFAYNQTYTIAMHIDDTVTAPSQPVLSIHDWTGATTPDGTTAVIGDADANGWIKLVVQMAGVSGTIRMGLGANGTNDTGDFTWSAPTILWGDWSTSDIPNPPIPNSGWTWTGVGQELIPGWRESPAPRGLRIERTQTNLIQSSDRITLTDWTNDGSGTLFTSGTVASPKLIHGTMQLKNGSGGGTGVLAVSQAVTLETSERYELQYSALGIPAIYGGVQWTRAQITNLGALTISAYSDNGAYATGSVPAFGTTAGCTEESIGYYGQYIEREEATSTTRISFTGDAADTTATVVLGAAEDDLDDVFAYDDTTARMYITDVNLTKGYINTPIMSSASATGTRAADILTTADVTGIPTSGGLIYAKFQTTRGVGYDQKTILSLSDGTANERIELAIDTSSNLVLTVVDGGATQATVTGATTIADDTTYEVAIYYDTNDVQMYLNGVVEGTPDTAATMPTFTQFNLGSDWNDVNQLDGFLQEVKVYENALSSIAEISNGTYSDPASGIASSPRGLTRDLTRATS